jgi:hypothetical protein
VVAGAVAEAHLAALFLAAGALVLITAFTMVFTAATRAIA